MKVYNNIINKFKKKNIMVIGDLILDRYIQGHVSRISPEAPVPVVLEEKSFYTPGGAANVAYNLRSLGAEVILAGRTGNDFEGQMLKRQLKKTGINIGGIFIDSKIPTITKTRVIAHHQQVVRIDKEKVAAESDPKVDHKICDFIKRHVDVCDGIIVSDYGKGLITPELVEFVRRIALNKKKILTVDPKVENFSFYRGVTAITPNLKEAENAIRNIKVTASSSRSLKVQSDKIQTEEDINTAGFELLRYLDLECLLITLGEHGMRLFQDGKEPVAIKTKAKEVFDVTGAGDTVISVFTLALSAKAKPRQAAELANTAAGLVVARLGAATVTPEELAGAMKAG